MRGALPTFVALAAERVAMVVLGLFIVRSIAQAYSLESFAAWQIAYSAWVVTTAIAGITGERVMLPRLLRGESTDERGRIVLRTMFAAKMLSGLAAALLLLIWAASFGRVDVFVLAIAWASQLALAEPMSALVHVAYARQDFASPLIARLWALAARALAVLAVHLLDGPLLLYALSWLMETAIYSVLLWRRWQPRPSLAGLIDRSEMKAMFAKGAALAIAAAGAAMLSRIDRLVFGAFLPDQVIAQFSAAMSLLEASYGLAATLATVLGARLLFRPEPIAPLAHLRAVSFSAGLGLALGLGLWAFSVPLVSLLFGDRFPDTARYLGQTHWLLPMVFAQTLLQAPLLVRSSNRYHVVKTVAALALSVAALGIVVLAGRYAWIPVGAYVGYAVLIGFDCFELGRRRREIYVRD